MTDNKPKFTPGPWKAHGTADQDFVTTEWEAKRGPDFPLTPEYICKCGNDNGFNNANLIAAAPAMYELLDRIKGMLEFCKLENSIDANTEHEIDALLKKARGEMEK